MSQKKHDGYNERLFSSGLRKRFHLARFHWLAKSLSNLQCRPASVLELGCFDGKAIHYLPEKPVRYLGFDANWENGLELARTLWKDAPCFEFRECHTPEEMHLGDERFDITLCMETLEHIPSDMVEPYLNILAKATTHYIFISVPNEKGLIFLIKYVMKRFLHDDTYTYTLRELVRATAGKMELIARNEHKGFDYSALIHQIAVYFEIVSIRGYPFVHLPPALNFGVGMIGKPKNRTARIDL